MRLVASTLLVVLLLHSTSPLTAQAPATAEEFGAVFDELWELRLGAGGSAAVSGLVLERDAFRLELATGFLQWLAPVNGRVVGAAWHGTGTVRFEPTEAVERGRMAHFFDAEVLEAPITRAVLLFTDSTQAELERQLTFDQVTSPAVGSALKDIRNWIGDDDPRQLDADLLDGIVNGNGPGRFHAYLERPDARAVVYELNPAEPEAVRLRTQARDGLATLDPELVASFPRTGTSIAEVATSTRRQVAVSHYTLDLALPRNAGGDVHPAAVAVMELTANDSIGPWVPFHFYGGFEVDSARWADGSAAPVHKLKDSPWLWVRLPAPMAAGETRRLALGYHGDVVERYGDFFAIKGASYWYPRPLDARSYATFDLTYHVPESFGFASVGTLVDSAVADRMVTTRWTLDTPSRNAAFNLGLFDPTEAAEPGAPPVTVLLATRATRRLGGYRGMDKAVSEDVARAIKFFTETYGPLPTERLYATQIPYFHGEAFPGLIHLSFVTFMSTSKQGEDEQFRAHEVAHQWWGVGVDFQSYRDQWLSEGLSDFSGLWYVQTSRGKSEPYFRMLDTWRQALRDRKGELGPIGLGYRVGTASNPEDASRVMYGKGAWVAHMLRVMMLDLRTMKEDKFTAMMRDYYMLHRGKQAGTDDFRRVAERHVGMPLDWFFDQWIEGTEMPTYRWSQQVEQGDDGQYRVKLRVRQEGVPPEFRAYVPVTIELDGDRVGRLRVLVTGADSEIVLPLALPEKPKRVVFNDLAGVLAEVKEVKW